jgi:pimeloyl-ACP methyl ester carboxylesterase
MEHKILNGKGGEVHYWVKGAGTDIAYGASDRSGKVQAYCDRWAEQENRDLKIIPNAAHNANMDNPEAFNQILGGFLQNPTG